MKRFRIIILVLGLLSIGGIFFFSFMIEQEAADTMYMFEAKEGFEVLFDTQAKASIETYYEPGTLILNGSYFGIESSGTYVPAGIWRTGESELSPSNMEDPNLSHIVVISRTDRHVVDILPRASLLTRRWGTEHDVFQAGPLVLSENVLQSMSGSWHALSPHERTLMGKTESGKIYFFVFTEKITLPDAGTIIAKKFREDPITLLNLDGGPSTAFVTQGSKFRSDKKLPILFRFKPNIN